VELPLFDLSFDLRLPNALLSIETWSIWILRLFGRVHSHRPLDNLLSENILREYLLNGQLLLHTFL